MTERHKHKYQRLSDVTLFCECGQIKVVEPEALCTRPHYPPYNWWSPWVYPAPTIYWPTWNETSTTVAKDVTIGGTTFVVNDNATYTAKAD